MKELLKPSKLNPGDKVAAVSLSWGGAGDEEILWRYEQGKRQMEEIFGIKVVEMEHTLKGTDFVYNHPEKRAEDLMSAFADPEIKGIIACIGGIESVRMLPYLDYGVIRDNPKIFMGYSDSTTTHLICFKAGISTVYGPSLLVDMAENNGILSYTRKHIMRTLFEEGEVGEIESSGEWTSEYLPWLIENRQTSRKLQEEIRGFQILQGSGKVRGKLLGGCLEVFDTHRGTPLFPEMSDFEEAVLFFETSEEKPGPWYVETVLRTYGVMGILERINGLIWGKPMDEVFYEDYKKAILKVMAEFKLLELPVLYNVNFGHTEPKICLPYGEEVTIDCDLTKLYGHY